MDYRIFQPSYKPKNGETQRSDTYHVRFRDHLRRRQTFAAGTRESDARSAAERLMELVRCRHEGEPPSRRLQRWLEMLSDRERDRLVKMDLIDAQAANADTPLRLHLFGDVAADGTVKLPGWKQHLEARGSTREHVHVSTDRVRRILEGCGFTYWKDLAKPTSATLVMVYLNERRKRGEISGKTVNYYIREMRSFCKWMAKGRAPGLALAALVPVRNAEVDAVERRALSVEEMRWLVATTAAGADRAGLTGEERALLYRFAFETGMRPKQMRALTVGDFNLTPDAATVTTHARYVKRRRKHTQQLRPALAAVLREQFKNKLPAAPAIKMPSRYHMAEMLRKDLAEARAAWLQEVGKRGDARELEECQRSDFLAPVNHEKQVAVFYSTRHGHGTALAEAGVPEKDIAASMHHASRTTTQRYIHSTRRSLAAAISLLPDLSYPERERQVATGTNGAEATPNPHPNPLLGERGKPTGLRTACAAGRTPADVGGQNPAPSSNIRTVDSRGKPRVSEEGPLAELADAMDSKSISLTGVSVRLR